MMKKINMLQVNKLAHGTCTGPKNSGVWLFLFNFATATKNSLLFVEIKWKNLIEVVS